MIIQPAASTNRSQVRSAERAAPMGGLNLQAPITGTKPGFAIRLDNLICRDDGLHVRPGFVVTQTVSPVAPVESLLHYPGQVFARTDGYWTGALVPNSGGLHLFSTGTTGALPIRWNGASWSVATITGVNATTLRGATLHARRVFMYAAGTLDLWYLGLDAIGGPASLLPLRALASRGGSIAGLGSMTGDGGEKGSNQLAIVTTAGELIIYNGSDPDNAATWQLGGVYTVPNPVGPKPFERMGGRLVLMTEKGLLPVPDVLAAPQSGKPAVALTSPLGKTGDAEIVAGAASAVAVDSASNELTVVHANGAQYIRSETGGWSRFVGLGARCWLDTPDGLFFGRADGTVCKLTGSLDGEAPIRAFMVDAYSRLGSGDRKYFKRVRPLYKAAHPYVPRIEVLTDYLDPPADFNAANIDDQYWMWSDITWPRQPMPWMRETSSRLGLWRGLSGRGTAAALQWSIQTRTPVILTGYDIAWETGSGL